MVLLEAVGLGDLRAPPSQDDTTSTSGRMLGLAVLAWGPRTALVRRERLGPTNEAQVRVPAAHGTLRIQCASFPVFAHDLLCNLYTVTTEAPDSLICTPSLCPANPERGFKLRSSQTSFKVRGTWHRLRGGCRCHRWTDWLLVSAETRKRFIRVQTGTA